MARVTVVGRGFGAAVHAPAWRLAGAEAVDVAGSDDWREAIVGADVVSVATPPAAHAEVALTALAAGQPVFCEKPLAATLDDAETMAAAARGFTGVNFSYRALPAFQLFRELAAGSDELEVVWTTGSRLARTAASWKDDPLQGGALSAYGVHAVDYASWILGSAAVEWAVIDDDESVAEVGLRHTAGRSRIHVSLVSEQSLHRVRAGDVVLENLDPRDPVRTFTLTHGGEPVAIPEPPFRVGADTDGRIEPLASHAHDFLEAVAGGGAFTPSFTEALQAQRLLAAARSAAR